RVIDFALDAAIALDGAFEAGALAHQALRRVGVVPEFRVLGLGVQLGEAPGCGVPVKDASSAAPTTSRCRRRPPVSRRACVTIPSASLVIPWRGQKSA